jgi:hypothetical protein
MHYNEIIIEFCFKEVQYMEVDTKIQIQILVYKFPPNYLQGSVKCCKRTSDFYNEICGKQNFFLKTCNYSQKGAWKDKDIPENRFHKKSVAERKIIAQESIAAVR